MTKKLIRIPQRGPILGRPGGIIGPIHTPYYEELQTVRRMVQLGMNVVEVAADGKEKTLTITNLLEEEAGKVVAPANEVKPKAEKTEPKVVAAPVKDEVVEKPKNNYSNKNNRGNKGNNDVVEDATTKK